MKDNFSEWPTYIPFIAYNEHLLFLRENNLWLCLKLAISYFVTWYDWQNGGFHRKLLCNVQKAISPKLLKYLLEHNICGKMFALLTPFYWSDGINLWALPFNTHHI